jgi:hypothetical protein
MFKFIYRKRPSAGRGAPTAPEASDDPFAYPEIASMTLQMLRTCPPISCGNVRPQGMQKAEARRRPVPETLARSDPIHARGWALR